MSNNMGPGRERYKNGVPVSSLFAGVYDCAVCGQEVGVTYAFGYPKGPVLCQSCAEACHQIQQENRRAMVRRWMDENPGSLKEITD